MRSVPRRPLSLCLAAIVSFQTFAADMALASVWSDRRSARSSTPALLASLPAAAPIQLAPRSLQPAEARMSRIPDSADPVLRVIRAIPPSSATLKEIRRPAGSSRGIVVQIQDVHANEEAQRNIGHVIGALAEAGASVVALEGASSAVEVEAYRRHPDRDAVRTASDILLADGSISGPAAAAMTADRWPRMSGIEDPALYEANVIAWREARGSLQRVRTDIDRLVDLNNRRKRDVLSPELARLDTVIAGYHDGKTPLGDYLQAIRAASGRSTPALNAFLTALEMERFLDFNAVERQRTEVLRRLAATIDPSSARRLLESSAAFRSGDMSAAGFYGGLRTCAASAGLRLSSFPAFDRYLAYVAAADALDASRLLDDAALLEREALDRTAVSPRERALMEESVGLRLASRLAGFALTPPEWKAWIGITSRPAIAGLEKFEAFYLRAADRNDAMADRVAGLTGGDSPIAVLVAGGFHTEELSDRLRRAGLVVITVTPRLTRAEAEGATAYLSVFSQRKSPLESLFRGERLFLAPHPARGILDGRAAAIVLAEGARRGVAGLRNSSRALLAGSAARFAGAVRTGADVLLMFWSNRGAVVAQVRYRDGRPSPEVRQWRVGGNFSHLAAMTLSAILLPVSAIQAGPVAAPTSFLAVLLTIAVLAARAPPAGSGDGSVRSALRAGLEEIRYTGLLIAAPVLALGGAVGVLPTLAAAGLISALWFAVDHRLLVLRWRDGTLAAGAPTALELAGITAGSTLLRIVLVGALLATSAPAAIPTAMGAGLAGAIVAHAAGYNALLAPLLGWPLASGNVEDTGGTGREISERRRLRETILSDESTREEKLDAINRLSHFVGSGGLNVLTAALDRHAASPEFAIPIINAIRAIHARGVLRRDPLHQDSIVGTIWHVLDAHQLDRRFFELSAVNSNTFRLSFEFPRGREFTAIEEVVRDLRTRYSGRNALLTPRIRSEFTDIPERRRGTIDIEFDVTMNNVTDFWRTVGALDFRQDAAGVYRAYTLNELIIKLEERAQNYLRGVRRERPEEYEALLTYVYGDGTTARPGVLNALRLLDRYDRGDVIEAAGRIVESSLSFGHDDERRRLDNDKAYNRIKTWDELHALEAEADRRYEEAKRIAANARASLEAGETIISRADAVALVERMAGLVTPLVSPLSPAYEAAASRIRRALTGQSDGTAKGTGLADVIAEWPVYRGGYMREHVNPRRRAPHDVNGAPFPIGEKAILQIESSPEEITFPRLGKMKRSEYRISIPLLVDLARYLPYFTHFIPHRGYQRWVYLARATGPHFTAAYLKGLFRHHTEADYMVFVSGDMLGVGTQFELNQVMALLTMPRRFMSDDDDLEPDVRFSDLELILDRWLTAHLEANVRIDTSRGPRFARLRDALVDIDSDGNRVEVLPLRASTEPRAPVVGMIRRFKPKGSENVEIREALHGEPGDEASPDADIRFTTEETAAAAESLRAAAPAIRWAWIMKAIYRQISRTPVLHGLKRTASRSARIMAVDELANGAWVIGMTKVPLEEVSRISESDLDPKVLARIRAEYEDVWPMHEQSLTTAAHQISSMIANRPRFLVEKWKRLEKALKDARAEASESPVDVDVFIGQPRSDEFRDNVTESPTLTRADIVSFYGIRAEDAAAVERGELPNIPDFYGMDREEAQEALHATTERAQYIPHAFKVDGDGMDLPILGDVPIRLEDPAVQISAYLKSLLVYGVHAENISTGVTEYFEREYVRLGARPLVTALRDSSVPEEVRLAAARTVGDFAREPVLRALEAAASVLTGALAEETERSARRILRGLVGEAVSPDDGSVRLNSYPMFVDKQPVLERALASPFASVREDARRLLESGRQARSRVVAVGLPLARHTILQPAALQELRGEGIHVTPLVSSGPEARADELERFRAFVGAARSIQMDAIVQAASPISASRELAGKIRATLRATDATVPDAAPANQAPSTGDTGAQSWLGRLDNRVGDVIATGLVMPAVEEALRWLPVALGAAAGPWAVAVYPVIHALLHWFRVDRIETPTAGAYLRRASARWALSVLFGAAAMAAPVVIGDVSLWSLWLIGTAVHAAHNAVVLARGRGLAMSSLRPAPSLHLPERTSISFDNPPNDLASRKDAYRQLTWIASRLVYDWRQSGWIDAMNIRGDPDRALRTVLMELAANSVDAGATNVSISVGVEEGLFHIRFEDDAGGFPPDIHDRLGRVPTTTKPGGDDTDFIGGKGRGLVNVVDIVADSGGDYRIANRAGADGRASGALVRISFPFDGVVTASPVNAMRPGIRLPPAFERLRRANWAMGRVNSARSFHLTETDPASGEPREGREIEFLPSGDRLILHARWGELLMMEVLPQNARRYMIHSDGHEACVALTIRADKSTPEGPRYVLGHAHIHPADDDEEHFDGAAARQIEWVLNHLADPANGLTNIRLFVSAPSPLFGIRDILDLRSRAEARGISVETRRRPLGSEPEIVSADVIGTTKGVVVQTGIRRYFEWTEAIPMIVHLWAPRNPNADPPLVPQSWLGPLRGRVANLIATVIAMPIIEESIRWLPVAFGVDAGLWTVLIFPAVHALLHWFRVDRFETPTTRSYARRLALRWAISLAFSLGAYGLAGALGDTSLVTLWLVGVAIHAVNNAVAVATDRGLVMSTSGQRRKLQGVLTDLRARLVPRLGAERADAVIAQIWLEPMFDLKRIDVARTMDILGRAVESIQLTPRDHPSLRALVHLALIHRTRLGSLDELLGAVAAIPGRDGRRRALERLPGAVSNRRAYPSDAAFLAELISTPVARDDSDDGADAPAPDIAPMTRREVEIGVSNYASDPEHYFMSLRYPGIGTASFSLNFIVDEDDRSLRIETIQVDHLNRLSPADRRRTADWARILVEECKEEARRRGLSRVHLTPPIAQSMVWTAFWSEGTGGYEMYPASYVLQRHYALLPLAAGFRLEVRDPVVFSTEFDAMVSHLVWTYDLPSPGAENASIRARAMRRAGAALRRAIRPERFDDAAIWPIGADGRIDARQATWLARSTDGAVPTGYRSARKVSLNQLRDRYRDDPRRTLEQLAWVPELSALVENVRFESPDPAINGYWGDDWFRDSRRPPKRFDWVLDPVARDSGAERVIAQVGFSRLVENLATGIIRQDPRMIPVPAVNQPSNVSREQRLDQLRRKSEVAARRVVEILRDNGRGDLIGKRLLEIGMGSGFTLERLVNAQGWPIDAVTGIDADPHAVADARDLAGLGDRARQETAEDLRFWSEKFDVILLQATLEHLPDPVEALRRAEARLAPGGVILVMDLPNPGGLLAGPNFTHFAWDEHWFHISFDALKRILDDQGLSVRHSEGLSRAADGTPASNWWHPMAYVARRLGVDHEGRLDADVLAGLKARLAGIANENVRRFGPEYALPAGLEEAGTREQFEDWWNHRVMTSARHGIDATFLISRESDDAAGRAMSITASRVFDGRLRVLRWLFAPAIVPHEIAHRVMARLSGADSSPFRPADLLSGVDVALDSVPARRRAGILLAGPLVNLGLAALFALAATQGLTAGSDLAALVLGSMNLGLFLSDAALSFLYPESDWHRALRSVRKSRDGEPAGATAAAALAGDSSARTMDDVARNLRFTGLSLNIETIDGRVAAISRIMEAGGDDYIATVARDWTRLDRRAPSSDEVQRGLMRLVLDGAARRDLREFLSGDAPDENAATVVIVDRNLVAKVPALKQAARAAGRDIVLVAAEAGVAAALIAASHGVPVVDAARTVRPAVSAGRVDVSALQSLLVDELTADYFAGRRLNVVAPDTMTFVAGDGDTSLFRRAVFLLIDESLKAAAASLTALTEIDRMARLIATQA